MKKKMFTFNTKTLVGTALGAALFTVLFMFVKIPTGIPETQIQSAYGVGGFFAALFGPLAGFLVAFIGHALSDIVQYGSAWWSWVIASGVYGLLLGLSAKVLKMDEAQMGKKGLIKFNIAQVIGHIVCWGAVAPILDILIYNEPLEKLFSQGLMAGIGNSVTTAIIGSLLCVAYAATKTKAGSLTKE